MNHPDVQLVRARRIITMVGSERTEAMALFGGKVVATGSWDELQERFPKAKPNDLRDSVILPGFNDAHMHPARAAEYHIHVDLDAERSFDGLMGALRRQAGRKAPGELVRGTRYDDARTTGGRMITRDDLDLVSTGHPVLVTHFTGHIGILNTAALELFGISEDSPPPAGGEYGRTDDGRLNGILYGTGIQSLWPRLPEPNLEEKLAGLKAVQRQLHASGITSATDAIVTPPILELFQEAERRGALSVRMGLMIWHSHYQHARGLGMRTGFGSDRLKWIAVKAVLDGAMSSATALLDEPYENSDNLGKLVMGVEELRDLVRRAHGAGDRMAVHANGDKAIAILLAEYAAAAAADPRPGLRHRVEHASLVTEPLLAEIRRLDAMVVPIMSYVPYHGDKLRRLFGSARAERMIACRSFLDAGITIGGSSDFGAGPFQPLYNIEGAVTRRDYRGQLVGPSQIITVEEALRIYTVGSAEACGEENIKGRLAPGQLADFVVLAHDPTEVEPEAISGIEVRSTWVGGEMVWHA